ncbi:putative eukaryotic translation initiation factor 1a protein [Botryosphaeria dothidea]|uniref:Eukaryotic translation initiation factor 4C n=1 Tax=Botryosphaeria dothidea TaxID=55169 RepID=A0A8H4IPL2_9PEZI|nr:putative eukaryotic translation initiation factor 1a protein [Botryosphaeria dothidea]
MPKNKGKGGKNRRRGKNENDNLKRELIFKEEGQGTSPPPSPTARAPSSPQSLLATAPKHSISPTRKDPTNHLLFAEYAQVVKMLGNGRLEAQCFDGEKRLAHIRGKMRKKVWINQGDIILLSLRDYQDEKGDVILKYNADEARSLKAYGELPEHAKINETDTYGNEADEGGIGFEFDEDRSSDEEGAGAGIKDVDIDDI